MQDIQEDYGSGSAMNTAFDGMEGQRPRLTHFSATAVRKSLSDTTSREFTTERLKKVLTEFTELTEFSELQA
jgi:hypothetical protein